MYRHNKILKLPRLYLALGREFLSLIVFSYRILRSRDEYDFPLPPGKVQIYVTPGD